MEAAGHPVASASRHQVKDGYSTASTDSTVPIAAIATLGETYALDC